MMITMIIFMKGDWSGERRPPASAPLAPIPPSRKARHCYQVKLLLLLLLLLATISPSRQARHCYQVAQKNAILQIKQCTIFSKNARVHTLLTTTNKNHRFCTFLHFGQDADTNREKSKCKNNI